MEEEKFYEEENSQLEVWTTHAPQEKLRNRGKFG